VRGIFIALEGTEGSGKSTIAKRLAESFRGQGRDVIVTREPGGTEIGERIRRVLLGAGSSGMLAETELLLFAAARAQHVGELIRPALDRGSFVIADRFSDSSIAYQAAGRGVPIESVAAVQRIATDGLEPDLKLLLDLPVAVGLQRRLAFGNESNRIDTEALRFHTRVRDAYLSLAVAEPQRWRIIDASGTEAEVWKDVQESVTVAIRVKRPDEFSVCQDDHRRLS